MSDSEDGGNERFWDHEDCPLDDCGGELQQQDRYNVMCLSCETVWTHVKSETKHYLQTADFETVAEKPVAVADGGTVEDGSDRPGKLYWYEVKDEIAGEWIQRSGSSHPDDCFPSHQVRNVVTYTPDTEQ